MFSLHYSSSVPSSQLALIKIMSQCWRCTWELGSWLWLLEDGVTTSLTWPRPAWFSLTWFGLVWFVVDRDMCLINHVSISPTAPTPDYQHSLSSVYMQEFPVFPLAPQTPTTDPQQRGEATLLNRFGFTMRKNLKPWVSFNLSANRLPQLHHQQWTGREGYSTGASQKSLVTCDKQCNAH